MFWPTKSPAPSTPSLPSIPAEIFFIWVLCFNADMAKKPRLFILDANALLHRAWHALPPLTNPEGKVVNAVYGTIMVVMKLLEDHKPDAFVACWDTEAATFRHEAYKEYKAHREKQPDELYDQVPWVKEGLKTFGIDSLELDGYEADDLLGTIAVQAKKEGWDVVIVTGDRDALQLVQPGISVMAFKKGVTDIVMYDEDEVKKQYGLTPAQFLEYKALRGDPSDNIPGMKGVGEKGATDLLQTYKTIDGILKAAHDAKSKLSDSLRKKILDGEKLIPESLMLVTIKKDVPITWRAEQRDDTSVARDDLLSFLNRMGFKSLLKKVSSKEPGDRKKSEPRESKQEKQILNVEEAKRAMKCISEAKTIAIHVSRGVQDSLFGQVIDGVVVAMEGQTFIFSADFLKKDKQTKEALQEIFSDKSITKVAHNAKDQMHALSIIGLSINHWSFDTMIASYLLSAGERNHDLSTISLQYLSKQLIEPVSASQSAQTVLELVPCLRVRLKQETSERVFDQLEIPLIPILFEMEQQGILIDRTYLAELSQEMQAVRSTLEKKMFQLIGHEFNPASPSQLADILYVELKLETKGVKRGKTGFSTAAAELEKLRGVHPIIELIEDHREVSKLLSTYVETLPGLTDAHGRIHTTYNQAVAATGRLSSADPNLQNIPIRTELGRKIRRAFVAEKGFELVSFDYSQVELRIVAALAKDKKMLAAFERGEDIHTVTAAEIWKIDQDSVTKEQRRIAKAINFGLIFGQGPQGLSVTADISFADAKKFIAAYFETYPGIKEYMEQTKELARKLGYVETLFGRRRPLPEIASDLHQVRAQAERMAINMPVQGTEADLIKLAMIAIHKILPEQSSRARMLLQVHDELLFEIPKEEIKVLAPIIKDMMERVEKIGVMIVVDVKAGKNWDEMEKIV
ncbi:DNA polymerase I [Candidatus Uhrbacteria bacterium]|nr:DNA polymerase I [Candidatus Uhrbacteria bacterium]